MKGIIKLSRSTALPLCIAMFAACSSHTPVVSVSGKIHRIAAEKTSSNTDASAAEETAGIEQSVSQPVLQPIFDAEQRSKALKLDGELAKLEQSETQVVTGKVTRPAGLEVWATHYYIQYAKDGGSVPLLDANGKPLGPKLSEREWCLAACEGTVRVGQHLYNYAARAKQSQVDCSDHVNLPPKILRKVERVRFTKTDAPFGLGVKKWQLVPFRTVAVDPKQIPFGTVLFIPDAVGTEIQSSDGSKWLHDGYFFAGDTGSAIKDTQIDVFLGTTRKNPFQALLSSNRQKRLSAYAVNDPDKIRYLQAAHEGYVSLAELKL